jgi:hypothetical protein
VGREVITKLTESISAIFGNNSPSIRQPWKEKPVVVIWRPIASHDSKTYAITGIANIVNDLSANVMCLAKPFSHRASIVRRTCDPNPRYSTRVTGIVVRTKEVERSYVNIDETLYGRLDMVDIGWLDSFLAEGSQHVLSVWICGAAGRVEYLESIK